MNCKIVGYEFKHLEVELLPKEEFFAEPGALISMDFGIQEKTIIKKSASRYLAGESIIILRYQNEDTIPHRIIFAPGVGLSLYPLRLKETQNLLIRCGGYIASSKEVKIGVKYSMAGFRSGISFQKDFGSGIIFVDATATIIERHLAEGESIRVSENCIMALQDIKLVKAKWNFKNIFKNQGLSMLVITGPGKVYLFNRNVGQQGGLGKGCGCIISILIFLYITCIIIAAIIIQLK